MRATRSALLFLAVLCLSAPAWAKARAPYLPFPSLDRDQAIREHLTGRALAPIEGLWLAEDLWYEIAIFKYQSPDYPEYGYIGLIVKTKGRVFKQGEMKCVFREVSDPTVYPAIWFDREKIPHQSIITLLDDDSLQLVYSDQADTAPSRLLRTYPKGRTRRGAAGAGPVSGTGFFIAKDLVVTNDHVVADAQEITVTLSDGAKVTGSITASDPFNDLALIHLSREPEGVRVLPVGDVPAVRSGQRVYTIGFPMPDDLGTNAKLSEGIVNSITGFEDDPRMYQVSLPLQPGNSGGPLFDGRGRVIGVVTSSLDSMYSLLRTGTVPQNVNFAIKINYLDNLVDVLLSGIVLSREAPPRDLEVADIMPTLRPAIVLITAK